MSLTFHDKITDFVTRVATTTCRQCDHFQKKLYHHRKQKIAHVAAASGNPILNLDPRLFNLQPRIFWVVFTMMG